MSYLLALWLCMPPLLMAAFSLPSLAIGLIATSVAAILPILLNLSRRIRIGNLYIAVLAAAAISVFISHFFANQPLSFKQGSSIAGLVLLAFCASTLFHYYFFRGARNIARELVWTYLFFVGIGLISVVSPIQVGSYAMAHKSVFPFSEPSHFALAYAQLAALSLPFMKQNGRLLVVLASFLLALGFPNTTMLVVAFLLLAVTASVRLLVFLAAAIMPVTLFITASTPDAFVYFTDRLSSSGEESLSRLVYIQGWESLISAISATNGIGIGFQNLGNEPPGNATEIIRALTDGGDLNRSDGGFLFAKLGGEFGVVGIIAALLLLLVAILSGIRLRLELKLKLSRDDALLIIPLCSTYIVIVEILVRGVGYFSPTFILAVYFIPKSVHLLRNKIPTKLLKTKASLRLGNAIDMGAKP